MIDLFAVGPGKLEQFLLVLVRTSVILSLLPVFNARQIPLLVRVGLGLLISYVIFTTLPPMKPLAGLGELAVAVLAQGFIALLFGFTAYLVFMGIQFAGEILDIQIGFAVVNIINPLTQTQVTVIGQLELSIATLIYLLSDSHLALLAGIGGSFTLLPLPGAALNPPVVRDIVGFFEASLLIVFQIAAPAAVALFITNIGLALLAKVAPQMNVFVVGFPLQIAVGLLMLIVSMPLLGYTLPHLFDETPRQIDQVLRGLSPAR